MVSLIQVWHDYWIQGLKIYDKNKRLILEIGAHDGNMTELSLQDGEKLLQVRSKHCDVTNHVNYHCNLVLVLGKMQ